MPSKKRNRLLIAVPALDYMPAGFFESWVNLGVPTTTEVVVIRGAYVYAAHNKAVSQALLKRTWDTLLWLEHDTYPEPITETGEKWYDRVSHYEEPIVAGMYFRRHGIPTPLGFHFDDAARTASEFTPAQTMHYLQNPGLHEVGAVPMGCTAIRRDVFEAFPKDDPWYLAVPGADPREGNIMSDDIYFCMKARELGFKSYIDSAVQCHHEGTFKYNARTWLAYANSLGLLAEKEPEPKSKIIVPNRPELAVVR